MRLLSVSSKVINSNELTDLLRKRSMEHLKYSENKEIEKGKEREK